MPEVEATDALASDHDDRKDAVGVRPAIFVILGLELLKEKGSLLRFGPGDLSELFGSRRSVDLEEKLPIAGLRRAAEDPAGRSERRYRRLAGRRGHSGRRMPTATESNPSRLRSWSSVPLQGRFQTPALQARR